MPAREKGVGFSIENALPANTWIRSDEGRIRQTLNNLIGNAVKFTSEGRIKLTVTEVTRTDGQIGLRFGVSDSGIGIAIEDADKLFRPFVQADSTTTRKYGGTGLGLAISKQMAEILGGEIGVTDTPGEGAEFWFTITATPCEPGTDTESVPTPVPQDQNKSQDQRELRILIAEDNPVNQKVVTWLISGVKCQFDIVENGLEAVAAVARTPYDVVLMDIQMPEMDGITATKRIRALDGEAGKIPIIAMTANTMKGDREKYLAATMNDFVPKPIDQTVLLEAIQRCAPESATIVNTTPAKSPVDPPANTPALDAKSAEELQTLMGNLDEMLDAKDA
jgi:CheY-like chemotaxis protein